MIFQPHHIAFKAHSKHHILWLKTGIWTFYETINLGLWAFLYGIMPPPTAALTGTGTSGGIFALLG